MGCNCNYSLDACLMIMMYKCMYTHTHTATVSEFCIVECELEVRESPQVPAVEICLQLVSSGPLISDVFFDISIEDDTAIGEIQESVCASPRLYTVVNNKRCMTTIIIQSTIVDCIIIDIQWNPWDTPELRTPQ